MQKMIEQVKNTEQARSEYRFISGFEMDALYYGRMKGRAEGRAEGMQAGILQGRSEGSYRTKLETARNLLDIGLSVENIIKATGLTREEITRL